MDAVNGAFMLMRRSMFEAAGGFDEDYWMYMEDLDLSYRLAQEGWRSWYEPAATVMHLKGGTVSGERSARLNWHFHRGMGRFYRQHYAAQRSAAFNALVYVGIAVEAGERACSGGCFAGASPACASGAGPCSTVTVGSRAPRAMGRTRRAVPRAGR